MTAMIPYCPLCRRETTWERNPFRPFCSERCQVLDLGAWAAETYKVPLSEDAFAASFELDESEETEQER